MSLLDITKIVKFLNIETWYSVFVVGSKLKHNNWTTRMRVILHM